MDSTLTPTLSRQRERGIYQFRSADPHIGVDQLARLVTRGLGVHF